MQRTELKDVGEFGLIERLKKNINLQNKSTIKGIGDDCAVIDNGTDFFTIVSTDMLIEKIHFDLSYMPLRHLGYKAIAVNVSDIAAMNGIPEQITVGLAISNRFSIEAIEEIYAGMKIACDNYKVDLVGGDTTSSISGLIISISVIGKVQKNKITYRNTAKKDDIICVTGDLGAAYMGLHVLEREKQVYQSNPEMQPELTGFDYLLQRQLKPEARMDFIHELSEKNIVPTSMIDISDGLASELFHICTQSGVGALIMEENLPIDQLTYQTAIDFHIDPLTCMMNGGEDYELLFTLNPNDYEKIRKHIDIIAIGKILEDKSIIQLQSKAGTIVPIKAQGWKHF
ncbi:MAG: thiamine-phosphate kinase [Bacteroidetes bacterium]|nr:MAG: thiamine-phosphate kinase [Bacteroidota bacterium]TAG88830.1 MAG: thiamine-phosphate kinase [Bacteroidota bacterium]